MLLFLIKLTLHRLMDRNVKHLAKPTAKVDQEYLKKGSNSDSCNYLVSMQST